MVASQSDTDNAPAVPVYRQAERASSVQML